MIRRALVALFVVGCGPQRELSPIRLEPMVTLGGESGDGGFVTSPSVSERHCDGFRIVTPASNGIPVLPLAFADDGSFLGALRGDTTDFIGRLAPTSARVGPGDSIWVFYYPASARVFDATRRYVRSVRFQLPASDTGSMLISPVMLPSGLIAAITTLRHGLILFDRNGKIDRVLNAADTLGAGARSRTVVVAGLDGTLWSTRMLAPWHLEHWDTAGRLLQTVDPVGKWPPVPYNPKPKAPSPYKEPPSTLTGGVWTDSAGRIWLTSWVPDDEWWKGLSRHDSTETRPMDHDKLMDTIIEVRDPHTGALIAAVRLDMAYGATEEPGVLVHQIVTKAGWVRAELFRVVLDEALLKKAGKP